MSDNEWKEIKEEGDGVEFENDIWDFATNDTIIGTYEGVEEGVGMNDSKLYSMKVDDKIWKVWGCKVLDGKMKQLDDSYKGYELRIRFLGKKKSEKGFQYKDFVVAVRKTKKQVKEDLDIDPDEVTLD